MTRREDEQPPSVRRRLMRARKMRQTHRPAKRPKGVVGYGGTGRRRR